MTSVYEALQKIPQRMSDSWDQRVSEMRRVLNEEIKRVWSECLKALDFRLPLLVMDEAHHLKNDQTQLAGLFRCQDAADDAEQVTRGALAGVFERMLFLTATPFQLGHSELCSVLDRFQGIAWDGPRAPAAGRNAFQAQVAELREKLDAAQHAALNLDAAWGALRPDDISAECAPVDVERWWASLRDSTSRTPAEDRVWNSYEAADIRLRAAEALLRPWVLRHLRPRLFQGRPRRERLAGAAIVSDRNVGETGLEIKGEALIPFLLAVRATAYNGTSRPLFAEGLASSYEAFRETRRSNDIATDGDDDHPEGATVSPGKAEWYLHQLDRALPQDTLQASAAHPKIQATVERTLNAWRAGEKVLVFCHFKATGRVLRHVISRVLNREIERIGAEKMKCPTDDVAAQLMRMGDRFFDTDAPARLACDDEVSRLLEDYPSLLEHRELLQVVCRRFIRTPSFLVRYFQLDGETLDAAAVERAFSIDDGSGLNLRAMLRGFFDFLALCCGESERREYLEAIRTTRTGDIHGTDPLSSLSADEIQDSSSGGMLPNVRLVNGTIRQETRQRLMKTFNSPFFPEILVASNVMAEGVDLHRFCRFIIHHDLCWNPSTLEQRTGRVDRIGAKVEKCGQPIRIYLPFLAETQDEKQYRVVMDRERWFGVVMGETFRTDAQNTEALAERVPLPESLAKALAFRLEATSVAGGEQARLAGTELLRDLHRACSDFPSHTTDTAD